MAPIDYRLTPATFDAQAPWLSPVEARAVEEVAKRRKLFDGSHRQALLDSGVTQHQFQAVGGGAGRVLYISQNLPGRCSLVFADLLFGEELAVSPEAPDDGVAAAISRIDQASGLHPMLYEIGATASWNGRAWAQSLIENGQVRLETIAPEHVTPRYAPGTDRLVGAAVRQVVDISGKPYVRIDDYSVGAIAHKLFEIDSRTGKLGNAASLDLLRPGLAPQEATGIDELTIIECPNFAPGGRCVGDYVGGETLIDEVNNRLSQISAILDKYGNPVVQALRELFDDNGNLRVAGKVIAVDDASKDAIRYAQFDARLGEHANQFDRAVMGFIGHVDMAPVLLGIGGGNTSADSWKKFKLAASPTLARVKRKRLFLAPAIKSLFRVAFKLENRHALGVSYPVVPVTLTWSDGLPVDDTELMNVVTGYRREGLMSKRQALMWIHGDTGIVDAELAELAAEQEASLPTAFRGGAMSQDDNGGNDSSR